MRGGVKGGGGGEVTAPPLCNLTQMTLMQAVHTETYLHRWEPLRKTLLIKRVYRWGLFFLILLITLWAKLVDQPQKFWKAS